ncbi:hypothetical protein [Agriterribacter sp.]|uniref:hypothetical protein n=1 Tax=Agriterribacter sp. TaxID=2821509 RepID=UPI002CCD76BE|nr:hypothetical protein [Agriterribacter sp.]HRP55229.1 hypothetical protein [Agriterribacter sp.]
MKKELAAPEVILSATVLVEELTSHNVVEKELKGHAQISKEHIDNNIAVRDMLKQRGVKPEGPAPAEDAAKLKRKQEADEKKILKETKKKK